MNPDAALPSGWVLTTLGDIARWGSGGTPSRSNKSFYGGDIPWFKTGELGPRLLLASEETITEAALQASSAKLFPAGSVALAMYGATIGKVSILGLPAATNQACAVGQPESIATTSAFLYQYLRSQKDAFVAAGQGGAQPNISQTVVKAWPVPLPPLVEQRRIVDKIDTVLARVDSVNDRLARVAPLLKRFRQSVLAAATAGSLVNGSTATLEGEVHSLGALLRKAQTGPFGSSLHRSDYVASGVPLVNPMHIVNGRIVPSAEMTVDAATARRLSEFRLELGDVVIGRRGVMGRCAVVGPTEAGWLCGTGSMRLSPKASLTPEYLQLFLSSPSTVAALEGESVGSTMINLNQKILLALKIWVPPVTEQIEVVRRVALLFGYADRLETRLRATRTAAERLTPALLAKAFRGELVPQDPNDEPASELLKRLAAQREQGGTGSARPRGRRAAASTS